MADNKTEKPTPRRRQKAREQGQVARSRELSGAMAWAGALGLVAWEVPNLMPHWRELLRNTLDASVSDPLSPGSAALFWNAWQTLFWAVPPLLMAWVLALAGSVMQGGFVFAPEALAPKVERLSPASKLKQIFSLTSVSTLLKSIIPFSAIVYLGVATIQQHWNTLLQASYLNQHLFARFMAGMIWELAWKAGLVLLGWAAVDYLLVWRKLEGDLKMSKEELRQDSKETDGNPATKARIRKIQRQMRRQQMLQETEKASVVITNPTHFAVALRYELDMVVPVVVAKGRDLLAQKIKEIARWKGIPVMENPPLAQALYRTVEVGQGVPEKLYVAVAEILAFVYRMQAQAKQQGRTVPAR